MASLGCEGTDTATLAADDGPASSDTSDANTADASGTDAAGDPPDGSHEAPLPGIPDDGLAFAIQPIGSDAQWTFYGDGAGLPSWIHGVTSDAAGNLWVAGGNDGLFLLRPDQTRFERFGLEAGLTPYAESAAHPGPISPVYLDVIAVTGGDANTVFVGYRGRTVEGAYGCEDNWDGPNPDPSIYKSGDADRVRLTAGGLVVDHYDISSGIGVVPDEPRGREKVCDVYRILFDAKTRSLWFGGNHGYAKGDPDFESVPGCAGQLACSGVLEHAHPLLNGYLNEASTALSALTNAYYGLALADSGDLWVGGWFRSQRCPAENGRVNFWTCESQALSPEYQIDWWPDAVADESRPSQRTDDHVSAMAVGLDGALWVGSSVNGLLRQAKDGSLSSVEGGALIAPNVGALATDPSDGSIWIGGSAGGITRLKGQKALHYGADVFGTARIAGGIADIQVDQSQAKRRILVAFQNGSIGIYAGE